MSEAPEGALSGPDAFLIQRAREGDVAAREELFRNQFGIAYRVAFRLLGNDQDALDAVQDAFLKAVRHLHEFDGRSGFRTWLLRIVTNASLDLARRRKRRPAVSLAPFQDHLVQEGNSTDPAFNIHREDLRKKLDAALGRLSPAIRSTFVLFAEAGLTYREIAEIQNVPVGTVMSRLHFARQKLQSSLDGTIF